MGFGIFAASAASAYSYTDPSTQYGANPLQIGSVILASSECPENLKIGLSVHYKITDLIGGGRVIQTFGTHPKAISWTGRIWGPNVETRKASLRQMVEAQNEIIVSHKSERYYCVITDFDADLMAVDANYSITIEVTRAANGTQSTALPLSADTLVSSLTANAFTQSSAVAAVDPVGAIPLQQAASDVQSAVNTAGPISQLTGSSLTTALNVVQGAGATASSYAASLLPIAAQYLPATRLASTFGLIAKNLSQGQSANTISVIGGSLAEICATQYGNADLWPQLGAANGIQGLRLPPGILTTLKLPPFASGT